MAVTPLPFLDRTSVTFKTDTDTFFGQQLPQFSVDVNQVATDAQASATAANTSKNAAATSATNAKTSETNAANSASAANTSKTNAATSETNAASSATAANSSKTAAANSATAAATSATNSEASAVRAKNAADSIASGPVTSVNGKTGAPVLNKSDIGLPNVDNFSVSLSGIGTAFPKYLADIDSITTLNGWYGSSTSTTGTKPTGFPWGTVQVSGYSLGADANPRLSQTYYVADSPTFRSFGRKYSTEWSPWVELTRPAMSAGNKRMPLAFTSNSNNELVEVWSDTLSIPKYLDRSITAAAAAAQSLDLALYSVFDYGLSVNTTFSIANIPSLAGETITIVVRIRQGSTPRTITWFSGITWLTPGGIAPATPAANQVIEYIFSTVGSPANWYGRVGAST